VIGRHSRSTAELDRAVIFQSHALLALAQRHGNVAYAVSSKWRATAARKSPAAQRFIDLVGLTARSISGRPSSPAHESTRRIARALSIEPKVMLMDEPFSAPTR